MRMMDIILKKRDGQALNQEEIAFFIDGYTKGEIPDYQVSALLMAIVFQGMNKKEIGLLTDRMMHSGDVIDLSAISGIKVDKHSTGGVGDKTSLVLGPMVAACGAMVAKMSGRGLGHTGGTLDKLESIPGLSIAKEKDDFIKQVNSIHIAIIGQTGNLVPADKKLYALRDVTGTVESIPLIASSIMSKKLASGSDAILLDVKFGSGAFMKTLEDAETLARTMVEIGDELHRDTRAILTDMDQPLGRAIGNNLEVKEAIATLNNEGPHDLLELCLEAGSIMLMQAKIATNKEEALTMLRKCLEDGSALKKLGELVEAQGGDKSYIMHPDKFPVSRYHDEVRCQKGGYLYQIDALEIGESAMRLGAGRATKDDVIDMKAGIILAKKVGDYVKPGDKLCDVYTDKEERLDILQDIHNSFKFRDQEVKVPPIVHKIIQ